MKDLPHNRTLLCDLRHRWLPVSLLILWGCAFVLTTHLLPRRHGDQPRSIFAGLMLREIRATLARKSMVTADLYFHRGRGHKPPRQVLTNSLFYRLHAQVSPREAIHRSGNSVKEVIPWLWFGVKLDPGNVDILLTTAYWLRAAGYVRQADAMLADAQRQLPQSPVLYLERARGKLAMQDAPAAARLLDAGLKLIDRGGQATPEERDLSARMRLYRAYLHEAHGKTNQAVAIYRQLASKNPARHGLLERRAASLAQGAPVQPTAAEVIRGMAKTEVQCPHEHPHPHKEHDHASIDPDG